MDRQALWKAHNTCNGLNLELQTILSVTISHYVLDQSISSCDIK